MFEEVPENSRYGYVRVSSKSQESNSSINSQKEELVKQGIPEKNIYEETGSASDSIKDRKVFSNLIENILKKDDLLMVTKIDQCSRNTLSFLSLQEKLYQKSVHFVSLDLPVNRFIGTTLAAIATFENDRRRERQRQGILAAKKANKYKGRKTVITKKLIAEVKDLKENSSLSVTKIARVTGKSRSTIYKVLKNELNYVSNRLV